MKLSPSEYFNEIRTVLTCMSPRIVSILADKIREHIQFDNLIFVAGNGGSAATAAHWVADLQKTITSSNQKGARAFCLTDNIPVNTAWSNDADYRESLCNQLHTVGRAEDLVIVISASGNSTNIVYLVETALLQGIDVIAFLGFDGGRVKEIIDRHNETNARVLNAKATAVVIQSTSYGVVEDAHSILMHSIVEELKGE